jgi:hypothetical protein
MVFFVRAILSDSDRGHAATVGQTVAIDGRGAVPLSQAPLDLVVN